MHLMNKHNNDTQQKNRPGSRHEQTQNRQDGEESNARPAFAPLGYQALRRDARGGGAISRRATGMGRRAHAAHGVHTGGGNEGEGRTQCLGVKARRERVDELERVGGGGGGAHGFARCIGRAEAASAERGGRGAAAREARQVMR